MKSAFRVALPMIFVLVFCSGIVSQPQDGQNGSKTALTSLQTGSSSELEKQNLEGQKFDFEKELETRKLDVEKLKAWLTAASILLPLLLGVLTVYIGIRNQKEQAGSAFELKAAEIVLNAPGPYEAVGKAKAMMALFPNRLANDFADSIKKFDPKEYGNRGNPDIQNKKDLLQLLAEKIDDKRTIVDLWRLLFPGDKWIEPLTRSEHIITPQNNIDDASGEF